MTRPALWLGLLASVAALSCEPAMAQTGYQVLPGGCNTANYGAQVRPGTQTTGGLGCVTPVGGTGPGPASTTPAAGTAHAIVTGGTAVTLVTGPVKGCYVVNPLTATDENIATAEPAYINAVTTATTSSLNGSSTALQPGQSFNCIPGQTTNISGNALTSSHNLVVVVW